MKTKHWFVTGVLTTGVLVFVSETAYAILSAIFFGSATLSQFKRERHYA